VQTPLPAAWRVRTKNAELKSIVDLIEAYEAKRWPPGNDPNVRGGKG
jgi:hypothetical protein